MFGEYYIPGNPSQATSNIPSAGHVDDDGRI
jgi:hypothetical protein